MEVTSYQLLFSKQAQEHIAFFKQQGDVSIKRKISKLLEELERHPAVGTGQPEMLRYDLSGYWSRRINREHRILYRIDEDQKIVYIYKLKGHY